MSENIRDYVKRRNITVEVTEEHGLVRDEWSQFPHYKFTVTLHVGDDGNSHEGITWNQGTGVKTTPDEDPATVLDALVSDATAYLDNSSFEDFARDFGYDEDSRRAERLFNDCKKVAEWLPELLGGKDEFDKLAYEIERL